MKKAVAVVAVAVFGLVGANAWCADYGNEAKEKAEAAQPPAKAELAKAVQGAKVALAKGLDAAKSAGNPISGKFEMEDGKLQLSVYTAKAGKFYEVALDHATGKVAKSEEITAGDDLKAAKEQSEAMAKAKISLATAAARAVKANGGFHAVSATPSIKDGHGVASIEMVKGDEWKTVSEPLD